MNIQLLSRARSIKKSHGWDYCRKWLDSVRYLRSKQLWVLDGGKAKWRGA